MKDNHGLKCNNEQIRTCLQTMNETKTVNEARLWVNTVRVIQMPVEKVSIEDGFGCTICQYSTSVKGTMRNHFNKKHQGFCWSKSSIPCKVQCPFQGQLKGYMQVKDVIEDGPEPAMEAWETLLNTAFNDAVEDEEREHSYEDQDLRLMNAFIAKIR